MSQFNEHMQAQYGGSSYLPKITLTKANGIMLELDESMLVQGSIGLTFSITQGELLTFGNAIASELRFTAFRTQELYDFVGDGVVKLTLEMVSGEDTFITYQSSIIDPPKISDERIEFTSVDDLAKLDELYVPDVDRPRVFTEGASLLDVVQNVFRVVLPLYTVEFNESDITTDLPVAAISDEVFQESTYREIARWALEALALNASIHGNTIRLTRFGFEAISITEKVMFDRKISENTYVYTGATLEGPEETFYSSGNKVLEYRVEGNPFLLTSGSQAHTDSYLSAISSAGFTPFKVSTLAVFDSSALMSTLTVPDRDGGTISGFITRIETKVDGRSTVECQGLDYVPTVGQLRSSGAVRLRRQEIKSTLNKDIIFENIEAKHQIAMDTYEIEKQERIDAVQEAKTEFTNSLAAMDEVLAGKLDPADLDTIEADILAMQSSKADLTDLQKTEADILSLQSNKADLTDLQKTETDILAMQDRLSNKADLTALQKTETDILAIQGRLDPTIPDSLAYQVASHTSTIAEQGGSLETLRGDFDGLEIGGRNYWVNSLMWDVKNYERIGPYDYYEVTGLKPNTEYTMSINPDIDLDSIPKPSIGNRALRINNKKENPIGNVLNILSDSVETFERTVTSTEDGTLYIVNYSILQGGIGDLNPKGIILKESSVIQDWTPAPEDLATSKEFNDYKQTSEGYFQRIQAVELDLKSGVTYTKINDIKNTAEQQGGILATLRGDFDSLEVGGRNLIKESDPIHSWTGEHNVKSDSSAFVYMSPPYSPAMYQIEVRAIDDSIVGAEFGWQWASALKGKTVILNKEWQKATAYSDSTGAIGLRVTGGVGRIELRHIKVEYGNIATDWTPAPEDLATSIEFNEYKQTSEGYFQRVQAVELDLASGSTYTKINDIQNTAEQQGGILATLRGDFDSLAIGGRNYIPNSNKLLGLSVSPRPPHDHVNNANGTITVTKADSRMSYVSLNVGDWLYAKPQDTIGQDRIGAEYIVAFEITTTQPENIRLYDYNNGWTMYALPSGYRNLGDRYLIWWAGTEQGTGHAFAIGNYEAIAETMIIHNATFRYGNVAEGWTPAPEDLATSKEFNEYKQTSEGYFQRVQSIETDLASGTTYTKINDAKNTADRVESTLAEITDGDVTAYNQKISTALGDIQTIRRDFDDLEIGGRNLIPNSAKERFNLYALTGTRNWVVDANSPTGESVEYEITDGTGSLYHSLGNHEHLKNGEEYVISFYIKADKDLLAGAPAINGGTILSQNISTGITTEYQRKVVHFRKNSTGNSNFHLTGMGLENMPFKVNIHSLQAEKGNIATDWSPAPEDLASSKELNEYKQTSEGYFQRVQSIETDLASGTTYTKISDAKTTADRVESTLAEITDGDVTAYNQKISTALGDIQTIRRDFDSLEIGGRNLIPSSVLFGGDYTTKEFEFSGWAAALITEEDTLNILESGEEYTISYDMELTETTDVPTLFSRQAGLYLYSPGGHGSGAFSFTNRLVNKGDKYRYVQTFTAPELVDHKVIMYSNRYTTNGNSPTGSDTLRITNLKLEKGNIATDWTPAPEDLASSTELNEYKQTSEGYFQRIQSIETDLASGTTYTKINDAKSTADRVESTLAQITDGNVTAYNQKISTALGDIQTIKDADYAAQISSTASELSSQISNKASTSELISLINQQAGRVIIGTKSGTTGSVLKITPENIDVNGVVISGGNIKANTISGSHITVDNALATKLTASSLIADQMWTKYLSTKELSADYLSAGIIQKNGSYWNLNTGDVNLGGILQITNGVSSLDPQKVITSVQDTQQWEDLSGRVSTATQTAEQLMVQFQNNTKANLLPSTFNFTPMPTIYFGGAGSYTRTVTAGDLELINEGGYYGEETRIAYQLARDVALNGQYFTLSGKFISTWNGDTRLRFRFPGENAWKYADIQNTDYYHDFSVTWQTNRTDGSRVGEIYFQVYNKTAASGTTRAQIKLQGQSLKLEEGRAATPWTRAESEMIRTSSYTFDEKSVRFTYDGQDKLVFDGTTGNLDITGRIHATGGTIGAWDVYADGRLIGEKNNVKIQLDPRGLYNPIQYNVGTTNYFSLNRDGSMYSRSADMSGSFSGSHSGSASFTSGSYAGNHSGYGSFSSGSYTGSGYFSSGSTIAGYPITATSNGIKVGKLTCDYLTVNTELGYGSVRVGSYQLARATSDNNAMWISSDVRLKEGIADVEDDFNDLIYSLPIISYALKDDKDKQPTLGINANLVAKRYQEEQTKYFIRKDPITERYEARYTEFIPMLIKTIQDLNERLKKVEDK